MWERRYGFPAPSRSAGGLRVYSETDIERLRLVAGAIAAGYRPREVVAATLARLRTIEAEWTPSRVPAPTPPATWRRGADAVATVLAALRADDVMSIETTLREQAAALGPKRFVVEVVSPLLREVGDEWARGHVQVRHEHLVSEILTREMHALRGRCPVRDGAARILLATLPNELHGLGLEMAGLYLASAGMDARVLGVNTPPREIARAARAYDADVVGLSVSASADTRSVLRSLGEIVPELSRRVPLWLGGVGAAKLSTPIPGVQVLSTWRALEQAVTRIVRSRRTDDNRPRSPR
jgi:methanogenic corrinoid protein MtbC1